MASGEAPEIPADMEPNSSTLGAFAGLSIEAFDAEATVRFWASLGYSVAQGSLDAGWVLMPWRAP